MKQRVITAVFIGVGFVLLYAVLPPLWAVLAFGLLAAVGAWELLAATGALARSHGLVFFSMAAAALVGPLTAWGESWHVFALIYVYMLGVLAWGVLDHTRVTYAVMGKAFLAGIILPLMLASPARILILCQKELPLALLPWLVVWVCDSAALYVGRAFGKRKLAPYVSPKKTVAGFVGGLAGGVAVALGYALWLFTAGGSRFDWFELGLLLFLCLFGAALGQLGDLSLSVIKRESGLKDYGRLFPGHGGVYDRFDSILFVAPLFELTLRLVWGSAPL